MTFIRMADGTVAHVRVAKERARRCKVCGRKTGSRWQRLCDFVLANGKTCDLLMCSNCAEATGPDTDLCPVHSIETKKVARDQSAAQ
jgi:RNA polymerase subunit RPABC4/transcription elongation factor Spt4